MSLDELTRLVGLTRLVWLTRPDALVVGASGVADASERASEGGDASDQGTGEAELGQWFLIWITAVWLASPLPETDCASADVMQRGADARNDAREGNVVAVLRSY